MRLRDIQHILNAAAFPIPIRTERFQLSNPGPVHTKIFDLNVIRPALRSFVRVPALEPYVKPLLANEVLMSQYENVLQGPASEVDSVVRQLSELGRSVEMLRSILKTVLPPESSTTLVAQVPEPGSLDKLKGQVDDLRLFFDILNKIDFEDVNGERVAMQPTVQAFDTGSFHVELQFNTESAIAFVGIVLAGSYQLLKFWEDYKRTMSRLAMEDILVKDTQSIAKENAKIRAAFANSIVKDLRKGRLPKIHEEGANALRAALLQGSEMLEKRILVLPPPNTPAEVRNTFPTPQSVERLVSGDEMKLLEATHSEQDSETPTDNGDGKK